MSCLERCPEFWVSFLERFHCSYYDPGSESMLTLFGPQRIHKVLSKGTHFDCHRESGTT